MMRILILDSADGDLQSLTEAFARAAGEGCELVTVTSAAALSSRLDDDGPNLVVLDYLLGDGVRSGREVLAGLRADRPALPIIAVAERGDVALAAEAVAAGATDFMVRGGRLTERIATLLAKVRNLLELMDRNRMLAERNRLLRQADRQRYRIVGASPQIQAVLDRVERVAAIPRPVLIVGERGVGKELVARAIHAATGTPDSPFVVANCAAVPDPLLESELFGHEKGAFTGADALAHGKFAQADGGTLFLDEIGNMSLAFQQKILRVVEYGTFTRVGGTAEVRVDVRILAATNADLEARIAEGAFLQDLYDRLAFEVVRVPPLRERTGDVAVLAEHFLGQFMREIPALSGKRLSRRAIEALNRYDFPGNVRELKNIIERAAYRDTTNEITPEDIGMLRHAHANGGSFEEKVEAYRKGLILDALSAARGNQAQAARLLGLSYHQFRYYHRKYGAEG
ncbi:MAG TPA: sigma-54 dependent transcriptional regulator [Phycisphaerae bacterium]|nr:sigma-54 dependent transcriptional regulator [Phycisphaerae bacterium]